MAEIDRRKWHGRYKNYLRTYCESETLLEASKQFNYPVKKFSAYRAKKYYRKIGKIEERFKLPHGAWLLWERANDRKRSEITAVNATKCWQYIEQFVKDRKIILFFDYKSDDNVYEANGDGLTEVLSESIVGDLYVSDEQISFLFCYGDDHDVLVGLGEAADWVRQINERLGKETN